MTTDAEALHGIIMRFNWDEGTGPVLEATRHPGCDRASALRAYWRARPHVYSAYAFRLDVPNHARDRWDLVTELERRLLADGKRRGLGIITLVGGWRYALTLVEPDPCAR